jgi:hypothetical protein
MRYIYTGLCDNITSLSIIICAVCRSLSASVFVISLGRVSEYGCALMQLTIEIK